MITRSESFQAFLTMEKHPDLVRYVNNLHAFLAAWGHEHWPAHRGIPCSRRYFPTMLDSLDLADTMVYSCRVIKRPDDLFVVRFDHVPSGRGPYTEGCLTECPHWKETACGLYAVLMLLHSKVVEQLTQDELKTMIRRQEADLNRVLGNPFMDE